MRSVLGKTILAAVTACGLAAGMAHAQSTGPAEPAGSAGQRQISVVGEGVVRGRPDMAVITVGVVSQGQSARQALAANTSAMTGIIDELKAEGIENRDLQTSNFSVEPQYSQPPADYDHSRPYEPEIVGYVVRNQLTLRIRELERTGDLLDRVIELGANSITGPVFAAADPSELEEQARRAAIRDAVGKAELYAGAAGVRLGPIIRIEESITQWPQPAPMGAMAREMAQDASVPIEGGELTFQAQVSVSWALQE